MSSDGNGNANGTGLDIIKTLFWGWPIVKPLFVRKARGAFGDTLYAFQIAFAIVFFLFISIPIGIIRLIITIIPILLRKRANTNPNTSDISNNSANNQ